MIPRTALTELRDALKKQAAVALLGPRQVGKTTLAMLIAEESDSLYLDLESATDRAKLSEPESFLQAYEDRLVILDEIHRVPDLMPILRGMIDSGRRRGFRAGRFLILGSASLELLRQSGETLAGRIRYLELGQLDIQEVGSENTERLWLRGGFPDSFLAADESTSLDWREDLIRTYLERDVPQFGPRIPAETLRRFWTMLAHAQGGLHNASSIGMSIEVSSQTVSRYTDLLVDLLLVRRLQPYLTNVRKRLVKSPKIYIRDSGLVHALLNLETRENLLGHPVAGGSWEGFAIENMILSTPKRTVPGFYRTSAGAEIDLVLELPGGERWAIEVKRSSTSKPTRGFHQACQDLNPTKRFLVHSGSDRFPLKHDCEAIGLYEISAKLRQLR
jgi:predicted AAA+ superfamily ATPase